jgi:histidine phosphotransfer protein HptB
MIDRARLDGLRQDIGEEDFADLACVFVAEMSDHLDRLGRDPANATAEDFHFLRGSAANLGLAAMADACARAEVACKTGGTPDIAGIAEIFTLSLAALSPDIPGLASAA